MKSCTVFALQIIKWRKKYLFLSPSLSLLKKCLTLVKQRLLTRKKGVLQASTSYLYSSKQWPFVCIAKLDFWSLQSQVKSPRASSPALSVDNCYRIFPKLELSNARRIPEKRAWWVKMFGNFIPSRKIVAGWVMPSRTSDVDTWLEKREKKKKKTIPVVGMLSQTVKG